MQKAGADCHKQAEFRHFLTFSGLGFAASIMLLYYCSFVGHVHLVPFVLFCFHNVVSMELYEGAVLSPVSPGGALPYYKCIYVMNKVTRVWIKNIFHIIKPF